MQEPFGDDLPWEIRQEGGIKSILFWILSQGESAYSKIFILNCFVSKACRAAPSAFHGRNGRNGYGAEIHTSIGPGMLACATRGGGRREAGHCFHLLFLQKKADFRAFFRHGQRSVAFCFSPTTGKICFPQYFGITRRNIEKTIFFR